VDRTLKCFIRPSISFGKEGKIIFQAISGNKFARERVGKSNDLRESCGFPIAGSGRRPYDSMRPPTERPGTNQIAR